MTEQRDWTEATEEGDADASSPSSSGDESSHAESADGRGDATDGTVGSSDDGDETSSTSDDGTETVDADAEASASAEYDGDDGAEVSPDADSRTSDGGQTDGTDGNIASSDSTDDEPTDGERDTDGDVAPSVRRRSRGPKDKLRDSLVDLKDTVQDRVRDLLRSKKALEQICRQGALDNLELVRKYTGWLREADLDPIDLEARREKAVESLDQYVDHRRRKRRSTFMRKFHQRADRGGVEVEKLSESPLTMYVAPLTVEVDFEADRVQLSYAREELDEVGLDPKAILESRREHLEAMRDRGVESPEFFDRLRTAYETALAQSGGAEGDRVDLVDLLAPLALLSSDVEGWRHPQLEGLEPYPRHLLAHQIRRLRRDGCLERDGLRIDLGTATGGSTGNKRDVLFIPSGRDEGQYYLSIRFTEQEET